MTNPPICDGGTLHLRDVHMDARRVQIHLYSPYQGTSLSVPFKCARLTRAQKPHNCTGMERAFQASPVWKICLSGAHGHAPGCLVPRGSFVVDLQSVVSHWCAWPALAFGFSHCLTDPRLPGSSRGVLWLPRHGVAQQVVRGGDAVPLAVENAGDEEITWYAEALHLAHHVTVDIVLHQNTTSARAVS